MHTNFPAKRVEENNTDFNLWIETNGSPRSTLYYCQIFYVAHSGNGYLLATTWWSHDSCPLRKKG